MSSSAYPRLYYSGHFYWNPSTYNNDDYSASGEGGFKNPLVPYNAGAGRPTWDTFLHRNHVNRQNFRKWSQELFDLGPDAQGNPQKLPPPEWNFFGGNQCGFVTPEEPRIDPRYGFTKPQKVILTTGYTGLDGQYHASGDPWIGQSMQFNPGSSAAKLVDVNPTVPWSSQIFADRFVFGTASNGFSAPVKHRMHSRWVGPHNLNQDGGLMIAGPFSAVFQTCFDKKEIEWSGGGGLFDAFKKVLFEAPGHEDVAGLMLRFLSYDTLYFHGLLEGPTSNQFPGMLKMCQLYVQYFDELEEFEQGKRTQPPVPPCNPAYSRVIGWIGPWYRGELVSMPSGRILLPIVNANQPQSPPLPAPQTLTAQQGTGGANNFGPAAVERVVKDGKLERVTIDLASTIPEFNSKGEFGGYGSVQLAIVLPGSANPVPLATLIADTAKPEYYDAYHRKSGLVDVDASGFPVTLEQFDNNPLVLLAQSYPSASSPATQVIALTENPLVAQTDERGVYANEPDASQAGPTTGFKIQVRHFGRPPSGTIGLAVTQYGTSWGAPVNAEAGLLQLYLRDPRVGVMPFGNEQLVDASSGEVEIGVRAKHPGLLVGQGMPNVTFYPIAHSLVSNTQLGPSHPIIDVSSATGVTIPNYQSSGAPFSYLFYNVVRVLPFDNTRAMSFAQWLNDPDNPPGIDEVNMKIFDEIFMDIFLMYPVMDFIKSPQKFQEWRGRILQVVDPARFESSAYMPVMRNLSSGKYRMLKAYDAYVSGAKEGALRRRRAPSVAFKRG